MAERIISILLIDDDTDDQELFGMALSKINPTLNCFYANDGILALKKLSTDSAFTPDIIFIDINMPKMDGMECLQELKQIVRLKQAPIYMYSTTGDTEMIAESKKLGATDFIQKQINMEDLETLLVDTLSKHNLMI
jgi:DNA-binding NtrC family response regulator